MCVDLTGFILFLGPARPFQCWGHESVIVPAGRGQRHASEARDSLVQPHKCGVSVFIFSGH